MIPYIDLHCDTAYELYHQGQGLAKNTLAVSLEGAAAYPRYAQFFAVWSDNRLDDEAAWHAYLAISDHFSEEVASAERIRTVRTFPEMSTAWEQNVAAAFLAVEDARLLAGKMERLDELARRGVVCLTLGWSGKSCICASHDVPSDEDTGLTDFGRRVVRGCFARNILVDISHASERTTDEVLSMAEEASRPVIATHSNAHKVCPHTRNLRDEHARRLFALGGLVGINLCAHHLSDRSRVTADDVVRHVEHWLAIGGERCIAFGGDLDGASLPCDVQTVSDVHRIADALASHGCTDEQIRRIFYQNAHDFIKKNLGGSSVR